MPNTAIFCIQETANYVLLYMYVLHKEQWKYYWWQLLNFKSLGLGTWLSNSREVMVWIFIGQVANVTADYSSQMLALDNFTKLQSKKEDTHYAVNEQHSQLVRLWQSLLWCASPSAALAVSAVHYLQDVRNKLLHCGLGE